MPNISTKLGDLHLEEDPKHTWKDETTDEGIALLIHGYSGWHKSWIMELIANGLKIKSLRLDMPGVGLSGGEYSASPLDDANAVKETLRELKRGGWKIKTLIGHSRGAVAVLSAVSEMEDGENDIEEIILLAPRYHHEYLTLGKLSEEQLKSLEENKYFIEEFKDILGGQKVKVTHKMLMDRVEYDNKKRCRLLRDKSIRVLFVHGTDDTISPDSDIKQFIDDITYDETSEIDQSKLITSPLPTAASLGLYGPIHSDLKCKVFLKCINGADHSFRRHGKELCDSINDFLVDKIM